MQRRKEVVFCTAVMPFYALRVKYKRDLAKESVMKRFLTAALCAAVAVSSAAWASAADIKTQIFKQGVLGTLNSSGASYEAQVVLPDYVGRYETTLEIGGEEVEATVTVVNPEKSAEVEVTMTNFDGVIYNASLTGIRYDYKPGRGFETSDEEAGEGSSSSEGGRLVLSEGSGLYSGRINFYYSMEDMGYENINDIPDDKWSDLYWFNLGSTYVLALTDEDIDTFLETGEYQNYTWPGLRKVLTGQADMQLYINGSFDNFEKVNQLSEGTFSDISGTWFEGYASAAYEYNLMKGVSEGVFDGYGRMTVAEGITLAARLHNIYYGKDGIFEQGTPWYDIYVGYALDREMIDDDTFDKNERNITRMEMASLLSKAVQLSDLEKINDVSEIPDVERDDENYASVLRLYNAGVLTGSEEDLSFLPEGEITRAEVAAMCARLVCPELRVEY